ncbi:MAG: hypothetical protein EPN85_01230 [Bacteroidetes bacterium]|nr:MAG: hypothetical protein EPN85_01230 [Bacteroidota bacterium]
MKLSCLFPYLFTLPLYLSAFYLSPLSAQENIFTAGFQYKPIFPSAFFSSDIKSISQNGIDFSISQKMGYSAGMVLRRGFTKQFSFETGINFTKRNFDLSITDTSFTGSSDFKIIGYEIPVQGMIFLRMADKIYANSSLGMSMDMYPSNIATRDTYFRHSSKRHSVFQFAALANMGIEYRTEKSGYFYLGASYHLPLSYFYESSILYEPTKVISRLKLSGSFLTLDFRYYFHEDPIKHKKKKPKDRQSVIGNR